MKFITDRREIAEAINFGNFPVVYIDDITSRRTDYGWKLGLVKIASGRGYFIHADLYIFKDAKTLVTCSYGTCINSSFGWHDVAEMAQNAVAPEIAPESKFVLVIGKKNDDQRRAKKGVVMMIDTGKAQFNTDTPIAIDEDMRGMLALLDEDMN